MGHPVFFVGVKDRTRHAVSNLPGASRWTWSSCYKTSHPAEGRRMGRFCFFRWGEG